MHKTLTALLGQKVGSKKQEEICWTKNFNHLLAVEGMEKYAQDPYSLTWAKSRKQETGGNLCDKKFQSSACCRGNGKICTRPLQPCLRKKYEA